MTAPRFISCLVLVLLLAVSALAVSAFAAPNPAIGLSEDNALPGEEAQTARFDAVAPAYSRMFLHLDKCCPTPDRATWDFSEIVRIARFNFARGRKIMACPFPYPDWMAALPQGEWDKTRAEIRDDILALIAPYIWAWESFNEACCANAAQKWGFIPPGLEPTTESIGARLLPIFKDDALALRRFPLPLRERIKVRGRILLAGPSFSSAKWSPDAAALQADGAGFQIFTAHFYGVADVDAACRAWKLAANGLPVHVNEYSPFLEGDMEPSTPLGARDAATVSSPQPIQSDTAEQARQEIAHSLTDALAFRRNGVIPYPHALLQRSGHAGDWRGAGYEWGNDPAPFVMKLWCRVFLWIMRVPWTPAQLAVNP